VPSVEVVGVYAVDAPESCHLIEVIVRDSDGRFDLGGFTQRDDLLPRSDWQVAYAEKLLDPLGEAVVWDLWDGPGDDLLWRGVVRLAFFFHHLDLDAPIATPFGDVPLPPTSPRPPRLAQITYGEP
jgi:hypothetical protein